MATTESTQPFGAQLYQALRHEFSPLPLGLNDAEIQRFKQADRAALAKMLRGTDYALVQLIKTATVEQIVAELQRRIQAQQAETQKGIAIMALAAFFS